jgi:hypothetical protein
MLFPSFLFRRSLSAIAFTVPACLPQHPALLGAFGQRRVKLGSYHHS